MKKKTPEEIQRELDELTIAELKRQLRLNTQRTTEAYRQIFKLIEERLLLEQANRMKRA